MKSKKQLKAEIAKLEEKIAEQNAELEKSKDEVVETLGYDEEYTELAKKHKDLQELHDKAKEEIERFHEGILTPKKSEQTQEQKDAILASMRKKLGGH